MKIWTKIHSSIDLITNSSTEMFIDFSGSIDPLKELINEVLNLSGSNLTCDDVFTLTVVPDWAQDDPEEWEEVKGNWTDDGESRTMLLIETKDEKYEKFGHLLDNFMSSMDVEEYYC